jgi:hypothetical protein
VFAIVVQKIVMALPEPRARTLYDVESSSVIRSRADANRPIPDEVLDWNFLDAAPRIPTETGIMDHPTLAGVNSMMAVSAPKYDEAGSWHPFDPRVHGRHFDLRE